MNSTLKRLGACPEAMEWVGKRSLSTAWGECQRGDWMLWLAAKANVDRRLIVAAACECARLSLKHVPAGETRPLKAIETAEAWCRGEATLEKVRAAAYAADAAADAAYAAAYAANAAAAYAAADAAYAAANAAYAAAAYAAAADARTETLAQCAEIVRAWMPWCVVADALTEAEAR